LERDHGYRTPRELAIELSQAVQALADARGEELTSPELGALFERQYFDAAGPYELERAGLERRREGGECAVVAQLRINGTPKTVHGIGNGPVEAFVAALSSLNGPPFEIVDYSEHACAPGAHAAAVAYVAVRVGPSSRYGAGRHEDVVLATFRAIISAYNRSFASSQAQNSPTAPSKVAP
jgi:2-isopropylmalate synthase